MTGVQEALAAIDDWVADGLVPGVAAVVVDAAGVLAERSAGVRERGGDEPIRADTLFALASLTKPFVGAACMVAVEEGLLDLDAEVRDGFALRHLLSHCAGLPEAGLRWEEPPGYPPGTQRWYSNAGYVQAAKLIEGASGMSIADYLREAVFGPLGMDASLGLARADAPRTARVWQPGRYGEGELFNSERFRSDGPAQCGSRWPRTSKPRPQQSSGHSPTPPTPPGSGPNCGASISSAVSGASSARPPASPRASRHETKAPYARALAKAPLCGGASARKRSELNSSPSP